MKKTTLSLLMMAVAASANAGLTNETETHKVVMTVTPHTDNTTHETIYDTCHYYYNDKGYLVMKQQQTMRYVYELNEQGKPTVQHNYSWIEADKEYRDVGYETYEYNADGTISELIKFLPVYNGTGYDQDKFVYTKYSDDIATEYKEYFNGSHWYNYQVKLTKNNAGKVTKIVTQQQDPDKLIKTWSDYRTDNITYQTNGDIKTYKTAKGSEEVATYYYTDLVDGSAPKNLKAEQQGKKVLLTWDKVADAASYIVTFDQTYVPVTGNSISVTAHVGEREFFVQSVYNVVRNRVSSSAKINVADPGILPAYNLASGEIYNKVEETESTTEKFREFYYIPLSWSLPQTSSTIEDIIIYYNSMAYGADVPVALSTIYGDDVKTLTNAELKIDPFEVAEKNAAGELVKGVDTPIYIRIKYNTGISEKSNTIIVNPYELITGIANTTVTTGNANNATFNLAGQRVGNDAKGIVIKNGTKQVVK